MRAVLVFATVVSLATPVFAADPAPVAPRTVDMTTPLLDLTGKPFTDPTQVTTADPTCAHCTPLTLGKAIAVSLCADKAEDRTEAAVSKAERCTLGMTLMDAKAAALTAPQIKEIEDRINSWSPAVLVRIIPLIDPNQDLRKS